MPTWTVRDVLDHVQELIGEPVGGYYNLSSRLTQLNQAQVEMVQDTRALTSSDTVSTVAGTQTYNMPNGFLTFSKEQPYWTDSNGVIYKLKVTDEDWMDDIAPSWRSANALDRGRPQYIVMQGTTEFSLYPIPDDAYTITIPFVMEPTELTDFSDEVFNGVTNMGRYAPALAYKVAAVYMMPRAPQLGQQYLAMYNRELRQLRHDVRSNPQHQQSLRPKGYNRGASSYWSDS